LGGFQFAFPEIDFPFSGKDIRDGTVFAFFNVLVGVNQFESQPFGQNAA
jgi:hypothetical protein